MFLYLEKWDLYFRFRTLCEIEIQNVNSSDCIRTIFKHCHTYKISENVDNFLIFSEKESSTCGAYISLNSQKNAVYIHWTWVNVKKRFSFLIDFT